jgi:hypothetical protein
MKKEPVIIAVLVVVILAAVTTAVYVYNGKFSPDSAGIYQTDNSTGLSEQQKIDTLISLNQSSTAKRLSNEERIKILQSLHK